MYLIYILRKALYSVFVLLSDWVSKSSFYYQSEDIFRKGGHFGWSLILKGLFEGQNVV